MVPLDPVIVAAFVSTCSAVIVAELANVGSRRSVTTAPYKDLAERVHELEQRDRAMAGRLDTLSRHVTRLQTALDAWSRWWHALEADWIHVRTCRTPPPPPGKETP